MEIHLSTQTRQTESSLIQYKQTSFIVCITNLFESTMYLLNHQANVTLPNVIFRYESILYHSNHLANVTLPNVVFRFESILYHPNHLANVTSTNVVFRFESILYHPNHVANVTLPNVVFRFESILYHPNHVANVTLPNVVFRFESILYHPNHLGNVALPNVVFRLLYHFIPHGILMQPPYHFYILLCAFSKDEYWIVSRALCNTAVIPLLTHYNCCNLLLIFWYNEFCSLRPYFSKYVLIDYITTVEARPIDAYMRQ